MIKTGKKFKHFKLIFLLVILSILLTLPSIAIASHSSRYNFHLQAFDIVNNGSASGITMRAEVYATSTCSGTPIFNDTCTTDVNGVCDISAIYNMTYNEVDYACIYANSSLIDGSPYPFVAGQGQVDEYDVNFTNLDVTQKLTAGSINATGISQFWESGIQVVNTDIANFEIASDVLNYYPAGSIGGTSYWFVDDGARMGLGNTVDTDQVIFTYDTTTNQLELNRGLKTDGNVYHDIGTGTFELMFDSTEGWNYVLTGEEEPYINIGTERLEYQQNGTPIWNWGYSNSQLHLLELVNGDLSMRSNKIYLTPIANLLNPDEEPHIWANTTTDNVRIDRSKVGEWNFTIEDTGNAWGYNFLVAEGGQIDTFGMSDSFVWKYAGTPVWETTGIEIDLDLPTHLRSSAISTIPLYLTGTTTKGYLQQNYTTGDVILSTGNNPDSADMIIDTGETSYFVIGYQAGSNPELFYISVEEGLMEFKDGSGSGSFFTADGQNDFVGRYARVNMNGKSGAGTTADTTWKFQDNGNFNIQHLNDTNALFINATESINATGNIRGTFIGDGSGLTNLNLTNATSYWTDLGTELKPTNNEDIQIVDTQYPYITLNTTTAGAGRGGEINWVDETGTYVTGIWSDNNNNETQFWTDNHDIVFYPDTNYKTYMDGSKNTYFEHDGELVFTLGKEIWWLDGNAGITYYNYSGTNQLELWTQNAITNPIVMNSRTEFEDDINMLDNKELWLDTAKTEFGLYYNSTKGATINTNGGGLYFDGADFIPVTDVASNLGSGVNSWNRIYSNRYYFDTGTAFMTYNLSGNDRINLLGDVNLGGDAYVDNDAYISADLKQVEGIYMTQDLQMQGGRSIYVNGSDTERIYYNSTEDELRIVDMNLDLGTGDFIANGGGETYLGCYAEFGSGANAVTFTCDNPKGNYFNFADGLFVGNTEPIYIMADAKFYMDATSGGSATDYLMYNSTTSKLENTMNLDMTNQDIYNVNEAHIYNLWLESGTNDVFMSPDDPKADSLNINDDVFITNTGNLFLEDGFKIYLDSTGAGVGTNYLQYNGTTNRFELSDELFVNGEVDATNYSISGTEIIDASRNIADAETSTHTIGTFDYSDIKANTITAGNTTGNITTAEDGTVTLYGTARVIKSISEYAYNTRGVSGTYNGNGYDASTSATLNDYFLFILEDSVGGVNVGSARAVDIELPKDREEGTNVSIRVTLSPADATAGNVLMGLCYVATGIGDTYNTAETCLTETTTAVSGTQYARFDHTYTIQDTGTNIDNDDDLLLIMYRYGESASDTYGNDIYGSEILLEYTSNVIGDSI